MFVKADIDQAIVTRPTIRMNHRCRINVASDNALQRGLRAVFCIDLALTFQETEDNRLAVGSSATSPSNPVSPKVGPIHFNRPIQRGRQLTGFGQSLAYLEVDHIHRTKRDTSHLSSHSRRQIHSKTPQQLAGFSLADSQTAVVPVFINHFGKLS